MGLAVWGGELVSRQLPVSGRARDLILVLGLIPVACAVYGAQLWIFKIEGREDVEAILVRLKSKLFAR
jgi:hypothetical protein